MPDEVRLTAAEIAEVKACRNKYHHAHPMGRCIDDLLSGRREMEEEFRKLRELLFRVTECGFNGRYYDAMECGELKREIETMLAAKGT